MRTFLYSASWDFVFDVDDDDLSEEEIKEMAFEMITEGVPAKFEDIIEWSEEDV